MAHFLKKKHCALAVIVAQMVERSLPIPLVLGSNTVIGKNLSDKINK